jgi:hypothetical protein
MNYNNQVHQDDVALLETGTFDAIHHLGHRVYNVKQGIEVVMYFAKKGEWQYRGRTDKGDVSAFLRFMLELKNR